MMTTPARVLVPSGLWGLVAATDPIPAHRLTMGARVPSIDAGALRAVGHAGKSLKGLLARAILDADAPWCSPPPRTSGTRR